MVAIDHSCLVEAIRVAFGVAILIEFVRLVGAILAGLPGNTMPTRRWTRPGLSDERRQSE